MTAISIPKPCHENWDSMQAGEQGRFCAACSKTVVDFTLMSDEGVKNFLLRKKEEQVCGRLRNDQLYQHKIDLPQYIFKTPIPSWKRFLAVCLFVFGTTLFSCNTKISKIESDHPKDGALTEDLPFMGKIKQQVQPLPPKFSVCLITTGDISLVTIDTPSITVGVILPEEKYVKDSLEIHPAEEVLKKDTLIMRPVDNIQLPSIPQTKNPPKADSIKCDTTAIPYS